MGEEKYYLAVILAQAIYAGMVLLTKATFNGGMNCYIFTFYRQLVGTVVLVPLAMVFERRNGTPLSVVTFGKIFMLAFLGYVTLPLNASNVALAYTTATFGAAILNCLPVATFFLALLLQMEKLNIRTTAGIVKVAGLGACMAGIVILTFYKGPHLNPFFHHHPFEYHHPQEEHQSHLSSNKRWVIGCLLSLFGTFAWSLSLVLQARILKIYPERLRFTTLLCLSSTGQCFVFAITLERDPSEWKLGWNIKLLTIVYTVSKQETLHYFFHSYNFILLSGEETAEECSNHHHHHNHVHNAAVTSVTIVSEGTLDIDETYISTYHIGQNSMKVFYAVKAFLDGCLQEKRQDTLCASNLSRETLIFVCILQVK
ncbi:WAT1-related protein At5g64700-like [Humulus lupulus]|uniref:WAT1-related protein At5g64700-like n=1 Tax=Humulus lupulus TaxID=3486 RepID=UPI002B40B37E|nr:WAT1-related protein At5g64700-like [Humulus lupulus]